MLASTVPGQLRLPRGEADGKAVRSRGWRPRFLSHIRRDASFRTVGNGQWLGLPECCRFFRDDGSRHHYGAYLEKVYWTEGRGILWMDMDGDLGYWMGPHVGGGLRYAWTNRQCLLSTFSQTSVPYLRTFALIIDRGVPVLVKLLSTLERRKHGSPQTRASITLIPASSKDARAISERIFVYGLQGGFLSGFDYIVPVPRNNQRGHDFNPQLSFITNDDLMLRDTFRCRSRFQLP